MQLPPPPPRGSFWRLGDRELNVWDVGVKLLVWGAVLGFGLWLVYALSQ